MDLNKYLPDIIKTIQELVRFDTVQADPVENGPFGEGNKKCLERTLEICKNLGFKVKNLDGYCGYAEVGEGEEIFGIIGHLDVVPVGTGWTYPPFSGELVDDVIWGRGTYDDKGPVVISIYVIKALMDEGFKFNKRVRLIFGCNEESGSLCMEHYKEVGETITYGVSPDSSFPVIFAEKTITNFELSGKANNHNDVKLISLDAGIVSNAVPDVCKYSIEVSDVNATVDSLEKAYKQLKVNYDISIENNRISVTVYGKAAHGSVPQFGINAASYGIKGLASVCDNDFVSFYADKIDLEHNGKKLGCYANDEYGDIAVNVGIVRYENNEFKVVVNNRLPFSTDNDKLEKGISESIKDYKFVEFKVTSSSEGFMVDKDSVMIKSIVKAYQDVTKDYETKPICTGGGTYAREFNNCVAFGPEMEGYGEITIHQPNERISVEAIKAISKIYYQAYQDLISKVSFLK